MEKKVDFQNAESADFKNHILYVIPTEANSEKALAMVREKGLDEDMWVQDLRMLRPPLPPAACALTAVPGPVKGHADGKHGMRIFRLRLRTPGPRARARAHSAHTRSGNALDVWRQRTAGHSISSLECHLSRLVGGCNRMRYAPAASPRGANRNSSEKSSRAPAPACSVYSCELSPVAVRYNL